MAATEMLQGSWNQVRGEIEKRWGQLTDAHLDRFRGDVDGLVGEIQSRTGETREAIEAFLDQTASQGASAIGQAGKAAKRYATQAAEGVTTASAHLADGARATYDWNQEFVRKRPGLSVATAFTTGLILGFALGLVARSR
ncbi:MAG: hypothetical protein U1E05_00495 [Patescibacteria group bacterium]|nr:hypothetical protein [Patescibacteria group bacterium]